MLSSWHGGFEFFHNAQFTPTVGSMSHHDPLGHEMENIALRFKFLKDRLLKPGL